MENSKAYKYLIQQVNAVGYERKDGYYPKIMEELYDWERDEAEDIIWRTFNEKKDIDLSDFMPKLKNYDGISALKKMFEKGNNSSIDMAKALYESTGEYKYLDAIRENVKNVKSFTKLSAVATVSRLKPNEDVYNLLKEIYINDDDKTIRGTAVDGLLYNKGYIKDPLDMKEFMATLNISRLFMLDDIQQRKEIIMLLESGKLEASIE